jgi:hypothetical protein
MGDVYGGGAKVELRTVGAKPYGGPAHQALGEVDVGPVGVRTDRKIRQALFAQYDPP